MRLIPRLLLIAASSLALLGVPGHAAGDPGAPLFPLRPDSHWVYIHDNGFLEDVFVAGPRKGGPGFRVLGYFSPFDPPRTLRSTGQDTVVQILPDGREALYYMLDAPVGTSWVMDVPGATCVDESTITVGARNLTLTVPAGTFQGVVRLDYRTRCFDAGYTAEWFAPGIGLIQRTRLSFLGAVTKRLQRVVNVPGVE